ncbi:TGS domain-containing protein [Candidatus Bathyarchaeota archaeon]|nr:TGS domain-containing protein [Candidatus Bathyarchaeota archaeon]
MVTNLPIKAKLKWAEVEAARNPSEKIRLMKEFLSLCPKHKGTSRLVAHVKHQIAVLEEEILEKRRIAKGRGPSRFYVEKAGAAQVVVLGLTGSGRSSLLVALTNANPTIGTYPYTTKEPIPGMLSFEDVQLQLVEAPALMEGSGDGRGNGFQIFSLVRNADGIVILLDASKEPLEAYKTVIRELEKARILVEKPRGRVEIIRLSHGKDIRLVGNPRLQGCSPEEIVRLLKGFGIQSSIVRLQGTVTLEDVENALFGNVVYKPTLVLANKMDLPEAEKGYEELRRALEKTLPILAISCVTRQGLDQVGPLLFQTLKLVRVYTKKPGERPSPVPLILRSGSSVSDVARLVHTDLYENFSYARLWGQNAKYQGERVGASYIVKDRDILEIHTR